MITTVFYNIINYLLIKYIKYLKAYVVLGHLPKQSTFLGFFGGHFLLMIHLLYANSCSGHSSSSPVWSQAICCFASHWMIHIIFSLQDLLSCSFSRVTKHISPSLFRFFLAPFSQIFSDIYKYSNNNRNSLDCYQDLINWITVTMATLLYPWWTVPYRKLF